MKRKQMLATLTAAAMITASAAMPVSASTTDSTVVYTIEETAEDETSSDETTAEETVTEETATEETAAEETAAEETAAEETAAEETAAEETATEETVTETSEEDLVGSSEASTVTEITFSEDGIELPSGQSGVEVSGTTLTITADGTYTVTGSCSEGSIVVDKGLSVTLVLDNLTLSSSTTAPIIVKKTSNVTLNVTGTNTLTDNEDASTEDTNDDFEGACIKVKSSATLTIEGSGTLNIDAANCKNGIKGAEAASVVVNSATLNITAANNGLASDGSVTVNGGTLNIDAENDGIKSEPDDDDTTSAGTVTITGGTFNITSGPATQADPTDPDGDAIWATNAVTITGGTFTINAGDDAIHSEYNTIIGTQGSSSGPSITVPSCYEGIEGASVYLYGGSANIVATDDGINAANSDLTDWSYTIDVAGGTWIVDAGGDAVDSNGTVNVSGGTLELYCASSGDTSTLDFDGTGTLTGGEIFTCGIQGMNQTIGTTITFNNVSVSAGSSIVIKDASGNTVYSATGRRSANLVTYSSASLTSSSYTLYINGTQVSQTTAGAGGQSGMPGQDGQFPGQDGQMPGQDGQMPGDMTPPTEGTEVPAEESTEETSDDSSTEETAEDSTTEETTDDSAGQEVTEIAIYRLYNRSSGEHFYTSNEAEKDYLVTLGWVYEGIAWNAPSVGETAVYRLYNATTGAHLYTADTHEISVITKQGWTLEGIAWYSDSEGTPVYRLYNPNSGEHLYTTNIVEKTYLDLIGWNYEGIAWYALK